MEHQERFDTLNKIKLGKLDVGNSTETIQLVLREKFKCSQDMYYMFSAFVGQVYRRKEYQ